jgi:hypothetical protein
LKRYLFYFWLYFIVIAMDDMATSESDDCRR